MRWPGVEEAIAGVGGSGRHGPRNFHMLATRTYEKYCSPEVAPLVAANEAPRRNIHVNITDMMIAVDFTNPTYP